MKPAQAAGAATLVALLMVWCVPAGAEPIQIVGGGLDIARTTGTISLTGTRGFTLTGSVSTFDGLFQPWESCHFSPACVPGAPIDITAAWSGSGIRQATATLDGATFPHVGTLSSDNQAVVRFIGSAIAPSFTGDLVSLTTPFVFEGSFSSLGGMELLYGSGTATLFLQKAFGEAEGLRPAWDVIGARYEFVPSPEPATLLLTAAGLAGLAERRRRAARSRTTG